MSIIKGLFGSKKADSPTSRMSVGSISAAPGATQEEQDANRARMEAELAASKAAREGRKPTEGQ